MKHIRPVTILALAAALLAGCSDGPSSSDVQAIFKADQELSMSAINSMAGKSMGQAILKNIPVIEDVEVISCDEIQDSLFSCVIEVEVTHQGQTQRQTVTQKFAKGSDGNWTAAR